MIEIEVFEGADDRKLLMVGTFACLPRAGEYLAVEVEGYFRYFDVVEVWHRKDESADAFRPCIRVKLDD
ncbi:hypothetical protein OF829_17570 [Sphingomonas sp. LB-2]|uniref:hypothetical protein n=1 Tax=Sphingomonas caeni TaxID=2984949 RepID=UPI00222FE8BF|nr:hypothetical protein [Sphingomonas caeni]MCW3849051.1 hypothetical protein [Sphingomonas caeni]